MTNLEFSNNFEFESWHETHFEIVAEITKWDNDINPPNSIKKVQDEQGIGGLYELAKELTNEFETLYKDREWDGDFFDTIESFINEKFYTS